MPVEIIAIVRGAVATWTAFRSGLTPDKGVAAFRALLSDAPAEALRADALALQACFAGASRAVADHYETILRDGRSARFCDDVSVALANLPELAASLPDAVQMMAQGYRPDAYAQALADRAVAQGMEVFAKGEARVVLTRCVQAMFEALDRDAAFVAAVERVKWAEVYGRLDSIRADTAATRAMVERLTADLQITQKEKEALAVDLAVVRERFGAQEGALAGFLRAIAGHDVPPDQRTATLFDIASRWREAGLRLDALSASPNLSPDIARLRGDAEAARERGDVDATLAALAQIDRVEAEADDRLEAQERRARERVEEIAQERRLRRESRVASKRAAIETALAALRHAEAAQLIFEEITLTVPPERRFAALRAVHEAYHVRGRDMGLNVDLERAVELARIACREAGDADERGAAFNDLAVSLGVLGERESAATRLEQAVDAIRDALKEYGRERVPLAWAMMQTNLGNALRALGERERGTALLEQAVAAYRAALEERTRERVPLDWAMTQTNLGNALSLLGERESSNERLEQAVAAYRAALEEVKRERVPLDWAMTQNNLGAALQTIGARESSNERLEQAVAAYSAALEERTRERVPLEWAMTQNNLGAALRALGERESSNERLEQAVAAFRAALEEFTPEAAHYHHAGATQNLAGAQALLDSWRDASGSR